MSTWFKKKERIINNINRIKALINQIPPINENPPNIQNSDLFKFLENFEEIADDDNNHEKNDDDDNDDENNDDADNDDDDNDDDDNDDDDNNIDDNKVNDNNDDNNLDDNNMDIKNVDIKNVDITNVDITNVDIKNVDDNDNNKEYKEETEYCFNKGFFILNNLKDKISFV